MAAAASSQRYSIVPISSSDKPILSQWLQASKLTLTINRLLFKNWPNEAAQKQIYTGSIESSFENSDIEMLKVIDNDGAEDIVGYMVLSRKRPAAAAAAATTATDDKDSNADSEVDAAPPSPPPAANVSNQDIRDFFVPEVFHAVGEAVQYITKPMQTVDHLEITYMYVKISQRRKGHGSQMVKVAIDRARAAGIPLVGAAEPQAYEFLLSQGFKDTRHWDFELSKWAPPHSGFGTFRLAGMKYSP